MNADEIRQSYKGQTPCFDPADPNSVVLAQVEIMAEIAAQLAELNENVARLADNVIIAAGKE